jgi:hypothetical protein
MLPALITIATIERRCVQHTSRVEYTSTFLEGVFDYGDHCTGHYPDDCRYLRDPVKQLLAATLSELCAVASTHGRAETGIFRILHHDRDYKCNSTYGRQNKKDGLHYVLSSIPVPTQVGPVLFQFK